MTSPFDPNYKPQLDMKDVQKEAKLSRIRTQQCAQALKSADPEKVKAAIGNLGDLSSKGLSPEYVKGRKKGGG